MATTKSTVTPSSQNAPMSVPIPSGVSRTSSHASGYFPHQHAGNEYDQTRSNTIANAQIADGTLAVPVPLRSTKFTEEWDASQRGSSIVDGPVRRSNSFSGSTTESIPMPSRGNTLKKKPSLRRSGSLKRSSSRRSMKAGSVRSLALQSTTDQDEMHNAFFCPVPTTGNPTEALSARFQAWRRILKDLITYFREIQNHYEHRAKSLLKLANVMNNTTTPPGFLASGGLNDALQILRNYNKQALLEANKAREIEEDVILALTGLRSDLQQKIKEIKNLSGDFKNSVDKEMEATRKAVNHLQEVLGQAELDSSLTTGKQDPYLLRLAADRQLWRQIDEENYLHQAYLNLENSGRELESIVVGEIQKSYNAYAGILKRESEAAWNTVEELRVGPVAMPKDHEWTAFVQRDDQFVDPDVPIRSAQFIHYPGRDHYACQEIRAGLLERKSKYLKSYTAGWYVLSPTHLHEFKSADKTQAPVMSLYLPEQKLGSHSTEGGSSNKFILKGRQTGSMHRGHTWVFRAESHDTMMAWYEDIKALTERTPQERSEFVRGHSRSYSRSSQRSVSSDGVVDEDDDEPFAVDAAAVKQTPKQDILPRRPSPGGRFPSDVQLNAQRGLQAPMSPASVNSSSGGGAFYYDSAHDQDHDVIAAASALPGGGYGTPLGYGGTARTPLEEAPSRAAVISQEAREDGINPYTGVPVAKSALANYGNGAPGVGDSDLGLRPGVGGAGRLSTRDTVAGATEANPSSDAGADWTVGAKRASWSSSSAAYGEPAATAAAAAFAAPDKASAKPTDKTEAVPLTSGVGGPGRQVNGLTSTQPGSTISYSRPTAGTIRNDSVPTISNLHIPGEFPRANPTT